ncbi:PAS domain-containing protein [Egicoccus sp. AB-alg2]|uniref:PAS domain-containing sensor histidine kinase n=1 Tax=Egicoccus sp. AB-alg2 TaxID=3242693 RepID=UPI00359D6A8E
MAARAGFDDGDDMEAAADPSRGAVHDARNAALIGPLVEAAPIGLGVVDDTLRFRYVNAHLGKLHDRPAEVHVGHPVVDVLPDLWPSIEPLLRRALDGEVLVDELVTGPSPADAADVRHWLASLFPLRRGTGRRAVGVVVRDVTAPHRAQERLGHSERLLAEAERVARLGSWEWLVEQDVVTMSDEMRRILGHDPDERFGYGTLLAGIHPDDVEGFAALVDHALRAGGSYESRYRYQRPDGRVRVLHERGECVADDGRAVRMLGTVQDVTEEVERQRERAELLHRSVTAADDERQRLAERLHDDVVQVLAATDLRLQLLGQQADVGVEHVRRLVAEAVDALRRTILELASADVVDGGLASAVSAYAHRLLEVDGIAVDVAVDGVDDLPDDVALTAYRITQEALANVRRHAHARHVRVEVRREGDALRGEVVDDGRGLPDGSLESPGHLGLRLMRERAEVLGGHASVTRAQPRGTRVSWDLPA